MTNLDEGTKAKLNGCGWVALTAGGLIVLGLAAAVIFVLFNIGAWIGGQ
jgi:hypothetical protein